MRDPAERAIADFIASLVAEVAALRAALAAVRKLCVDEVASVWHVSEPFAASILAVLDEATP